MWMPERGPHFAFHGYESDPGKGKQLNVIADLEVASRGQHFAVALDECARRLPLQRRGVAGGRASPAVAAWLALGTVPSELRLTFDPVTAPFLIFAVVTEFFFSCFGPTLFF